MTSADFEICWQRLCKLWPGGQWANDATRDHWMGVLMGWPFATVEAAIRDHWEANAAGFKPDPKAIRKLCKVHKDQSVSPQQAKLLEAWPRMNKLQQARYSRDSLNAQADKCQDEKEAAELRFKASLYADHAARLYRLHADDVPPRYGDRTLKPEPWGEDLKPPVTKGRERDPVPIGKIVPKVLAEFSATLDDGVPF